MARLSTWMIVIGIVLTVFPEPATSGFGLGLLVAGIALRLFTDS